MEKVYPKRFVLVKYTTGTKKKNCKKKITCGCSAVVQLKLNRMRSSRECQKGHAHCGSPLAIRKEMVTRRFCGEKSQARPFPFRFWQRFVAIHDGMSIAWGQGGESGMAPSVLEALLLPIPGALWKRVN